MLNLIFFKKEWFGISISQGLKFFFFLIENQFYFFLKKDPIETFTIDDSLSPLQVIKKYIKSNILLHRYFDKK